MNTLKLTHYNDINADYYLHSFQKTILDVEIFKFNCTIFSTRKMQLMNWTKLEFIMLI